jgi:hypothetical protein
MLATMPARDYARWYWHYRAEPWGNEEKGKRTAAHAKAVSQEARGLSDDFFTVAAPTSKELEEMEQWEREAAEFDSVARQRRIARQGE